MHFAYLYSRYPVISQTFCDTEMLALERRGWSFEIGSIHPPFTSFRHGHADKLQAPIYYAPPQQILQVWEREGRKVSRVAARLSVSPKKVRRILNRVGRRKPRRD